MDATAIGVSVLRNDIDTAGSIMFLLGIGELLEEWTHKKSVDDLARSMVCLSISVRFGLLEMSRRFWYRHRIFKQRRYGLC